jgi:hypothetical protein
VALANHSIQSAGRAPNIEVTHGCINVLVVGIPRWLDLVIG